MIATERKHKLYLGKCDYNGSGRRNCKAFITWKLKNGPKGPCFSMCAEIWNPREQEAWLKANPIHPRNYVYPKTHFGKVCELLAAAGLNPDMTYSLGANANGREVFGYKYGSAWLYTPIPEDVLTEIRAW